MVRVRNRLFIVALSIAVLIISASVTKAQDTDPTLILSLSFDDGSGKVAKDLSKYSNNGALKGDPKWVDGKFGKALQLNGSTDWVEVPHADILSVDKEVTVMIWVKMDRYEVPASGYTGIVSKSNSPRSYSLYTTAAGILHFSTNGIGTVSIATVPLKEWTHIAAVVVGGKHRYYFNGKLDSESGDAVVLPGISDKAVVLIGKTPEASREYQGIIDEVRIWNKALKIDEIVKQMDKGGKTAAVQPNSKLAMTWAGLKR